MFSATIIFLLFIKRNGICANEFYGGNSEIACLLGALGYSPSFLESAIASCKAESSTYPTNPHIRNNTIDHLVENFRSFTEELISRIKNIEELLVKRTTSCLNNNTSSNNTINNPEELDTSTEKNQTDIKYPKDCHQWMLVGDTKSGIKRIFYDSTYPTKSAKVRCNQVTDGGGWTVIQSRMDVNPREDFQRSWDNYVKGFGNVEKEYWFGLEKIHLLTSLYPTELRFDLEDYEGNKVYAKFNSFTVHNASTFYKMNVAGYTGSAGNSFLGHNNYKFSTKDKDNDAYPSNCAEIYKGGFWHSNCVAANINGYQHRGSISPYGEGITWSSFKGYSYSLKTVEMKIRPLI